MIAKIISALSLSAIVHFITEWTDLLRVPYLTHPDWAERANATARPFSVAAFLLTVLLFSRLSRASLLRLSILFICCWLALMGGCLLFYTFLGSIPDGPTIERAIYAWFLIFEVAQVTAVVATATTAMWAVS